MVRWNAGTGHVKPHRQTLSPAGPKIEIQKGFTHDEYREVGQRVPIFSACSSRAAFFALYVLYKGNPLGQLQL
jgi:hypothetical protein